MPVVLSQNIPYIDKYFVPGQTITSETLNKHASFYFSEKRCYVVRDLNIGYIQSQSKLVIYPGSFVVSYVLVVIKEIIEITVPPNTEPFLYIVGTYNPEQCFTIPPTIQIITPDQYNENVMCLLGTLINNQEVDIRNRPTINIKTTSIPLTEIVTVSFDITLPEFTITYPYGEFELINLFLNGIYLQRDIDYTYNEITKQVKILNFQATIVSVICEIKVTNGLVFSRSLTLSSIYFYKDITQSSDIYLMDEFTKQYIEIAKTGYITIFLNSVLLSQPDDYVILEDDLQIKFSTNLNQGSKVVVIYDTNWFYDFMPFCNYDYYYKKINNPTTTFVLTNPSIYETVVYLNGILMTENIDYTLDTTKQIITFYEYLQANDNLQVYAKKANDITNREIILTTNLTDTIYFNSTPTKGMFLVYVNGAFIEANFSSYNVDLINKKIIFNTNISQNSLVQIFSR